MFDPTDERGVPTSRGVPKVVIIAATIGILTIFAVGGWTIAKGGYGHVWPAQQALRIPLSGSNAYQH